MLTGELSIPVRSHPSGLWMGMSLAVDIQHVVFMVLDTGSPVSAVSPTVARDLHAVGLLSPRAVPGAFLISGLRAREAVGQPALPDLTVRILPRLARLQIDGLLGLDFFRQFGRVCFHLSTLRLELTY